MRSSLTRIWDHLAWAAERLDRRLTEAVRDEVGEPGAEARSESLRLLAHLVYAERIWLDRIATGTSDHRVWPDPENPPKLEAIRALQDGTLAEGRALLRDAATRLTRPVRYRNSSGTSFQAELGDILLHVGLHGAYHRGQVARALRQGGLEPVNTDYITWVRAGSPSPAPR